MKKGEHRQFCPKGHDTFIVGRVPRGNCRQCITDYLAKYNKKYYQNNKEQIIKQNRQYALIHLEETAERQKKWKEEHREEYNTYHNELYSKDINHKLAVGIRTRINVALKGKIKPASAVKMLGCTIEFLKQYLEAKFLPGMSWENHGFGNDKWHMDHILPLDSFDLTDSKQFAKACHYTNLQPLWQSDNLRKSNKI